MPGVLRILALISLALLAGCAGLRSEVSVTYQSGDCSVSAKAWR